MSLLDRPELAGIPEGMSPDDAELLAAALALLDSVYETGRHEVVAAMRTANGTIHLGAHLEASSGRASVCAEGAALGAALVAGAGTPLDIQAVVSVLRRPGGTEHIIEPCGVCAELLTDYSPAARVWVALDDGVQAIAALELLPAKRLRTGRR